MGSYTGGQIIVECLKQLDVKYIFGIPGHGVQGIYDALYDSNIEVVLTHHEMVAAAAAAGYFKATHNPGVVIVSCGPGMVTAIPSLVQAAIDCSAVVVIAGDTTIKYRGKGASEEIDVHSDGDQSTFYRPFAKRIWQVLATEQIPDIMSNAFTVAMTGKPGPVLVNVPFDLQSEVINLKIPDIRRRRPTGMVTTDKESLRLVAELLAKSKKPILLAGGGAAISGASTEVVELAEMIGCEVVTSNAGKSVIASSHPLYAGNCGREGPEFSRKLTREADVILAMGTRFEEYEATTWKEGVTFKIPPTKLIHINIDPREIGKIYPVDVGIAGDVKTVSRDLINVLRPLVKDRSQRKSVTMKKLQRLKKQWLDSHKVYDTSESIPINPYRLIRELKEVLPKNAVFVVEVSTVRSLANQYCFPVCENNYFAEQGFQLIGYAPMEALGIKIGRPDQPVIALVGDGAFLLSNQVVPTAVEYDIPVVWVVLNNYGYNSVATCQKRYFKGRYIATIFKFRGTDKLYTPDYAKIAEAYGAKGKRVEKPDDIRPALEEALKSERPYVIDVVVDMFAVTSLIEEGYTLSSWNDFWPSWSRKDLR